MVYHINHPNELCAQIKEGVTQLRKQSVTVFNQSVLLKDVNDNVDVLKELSYGLFDAGIIPYYVHLLDKVQGAQQFEVDFLTAQSLQHGLRALLPGYLMPRFVRECPKAPSKVPLDLLID